MNPNGETVMQQTPVIRVLIEYVPATGELRVGWPPLDAIGKLGLLEAVKTSVIQENLQRAMGIEPSRLVQVPPGTKLS